MKSIIFYGTLVVLHKKIVRIQSNRYYIFKNSIIEDHEKLNRYTTLTELESVIKGHTKRDSLNKEYFIEENIENIGPLKEKWFVFEYIPTQIKTFFNTTATNTITTLLMVKDDESYVSDDNTDTSTDSRYK